MTVFAAKDAQGVTLEIVPHVYPATQLPTEHYRAQARTVFEALTRLPGATHDALLLLLLRQEIDWYQDRSDEYGRIAAGMLLPIADLYEKRLANPLA